MGISTPLKLKKDNSIHYLMRDNSIHYLMRDVKYLAFALMFMFSLVSVCATDVYKQGDSSNIQFTCTVNYQVPSAGATYNFSIYYLLFSNS